MVTLIWLSYLAVGAIVVGGLANLGRPDDE
jgi:hypothetical protein